MNKKELASKVAEVLKKNDIRKSVKLPEQVFRISDNDGNAKDFTVKTSDKRVLFNLDDITSIIDACLIVIEDSIKRGEPIHIYGFGTLGLNYRKERMTRRIDNGEPIDVPARYVPKFDYGQRLRLAARLYEDSLKESGVLKDKTFEIEEDDE